MPDDEQTVRTWLVERSFDDRDLVTVVYATPDGERSFTRELSATVLQGTAITAGETVDPDRLTPVDDPARRERYREEAERIRGRHEPDDAV